MTELSGVLRRAKLPSMLRASGAAAAGRIAILAAGLGSSLLLPLALPQDKVGIYFIAQILTAGFAILAMMGLTFTAPALVSAAAARGDFGRARDAIMRIQGIVGGFGLIVACAFWLADRWIPSGANVTAWSGVLAIVALQIPCAALGAVQVELLRAIHSIRSSAFLMAFPSTAVALFLAFALTTRLQPSLHQVLLCSFAGYAIAAGVGAFSISSSCRRWSQVAKEPIGAGAIIRRTLPNLATTLVLFGLSQVDMILLTLLSSLQEIAQYGIALRISTVLIMPLSIANSAFAPSAVHLWTLDDRTGLQKALRLLVSVATLLTFLMYAGLAVLGYTLVHLWNPHYENSLWLALILGAGQLGHVLGGSSGILLMVLGDEKVAFRITLVTGVATVALCSVGILVGGPYLLAAAAAACNVLQVFFFARRVRERFKVDATFKSLFRKKVPTSEV
ncbi:hypothetical protein [Mesorhizobium sp. B2-4-17]|uniref:lipopolysaccharide biosynthesis protein n=1 Tax=Mesorhizobium sp. B2-4-17 TaxID=2589932 RepID=UPI00112D2FB5|nr:hypothetical protein [Mesorhizobium sp. B2-4-17]TPK83091.1 hypothetical protein FJ548_19785 [Mesorhizobium sp. B2-4-17]